MAFAAANTRDTQMVEMNITPLVDVMLVLLVIFMIAMPAVSQTLAIDLPVGTNRRHRGQTDPAAADRRRRPVHARWRGLGPSATWRSASRAPRTRPRCPWSLDVRISPDAEYETVAQGLTAARNAGIANINFVDR